jgi:NAD(P)-dependent dehydrogenase (short-subunit alcohol dehydrogenase family)
MDYGLAGKVAVVTGAGRGIGLAVVQALAAEGVHVVAGSRTVTPELAALDNVTGVAVDLATPDGPAKLVSVAGPRVDILVNNVGSAPARTAGFLSVTEDEWQSTLTLNFLAAVRACRAVLPLMVTAQSGSIVTISSVNATLADPNVVDYSTAKSALSNLCKSLSKEFGPQGVRVNTVSPGPVATDLWLGHGGVAATVSAVTGQTPEQVAAAAAAGSPTGRFSQPAEVAAAVLFLASAQADNINGADITIDGGLIPTWR